MPEHRPPDIPAAPFPWLGFAVLIGLIATAIAVALGYPDPGCP